MKKYLVLFLTLFSSIPCLSLSAKDDPPEWVKQRREARFADALYLQAVGQAELGKNSAEAMAQAEMVAKNQIAEQLRVTIQSRLITFKFEGLYGQSYQEQASEQMSTATQLTLAGLIIHDRFIDKKNKICYALAVLNRLAALKGIDQEMLMLMHDARSARNEAQHLLLSARPFQAVLNLRRAFHLIKAAEECQLIVPILKLPGSSAVNLPISPTRAEILQQLSEAGEKLKIAIQPTSFQIHTLSELPVRFSAILSYGDKYLDDFPLQCTFIRGHGQAKTMGLTDASGRSDIWVTNLSSAASGDYEIEVAPDISNLTIAFDQPDHATWNEALKHAFRPAKLSLKKLELDLNDYCAGAAEDLVNRISISNGLFKLIAGSLTYAETGASSDFVAYLKDKLTSELALTNKIQFIAPEKIVQTIRQARETYRGVKRPDSPEILAELIDADGVLVGTYWDRQNELECNLKIVERNSGAALSTAALKLPRSLIPRELSFLPANFARFSQVNELGNIEAPKDDLKVDVWTDRGNGAIYKRGDKLTVFVRASHDCYLYLIYHDADGNDILIYPNARQANNRILGGVIYQIPDARDTFDFKVQAPFGSELIKAVVADVALPELNGKVLSNGLKLLTGSFKDHLVRVRGITAQARQNGYAEATCVLTTMR